VPVQFIIITNKIKSIRFMIQTLNFQMYGKTKLKN